jgi:GTP-binding protein
MTFTVAIVGRPNVGKSTLFNRLVGKSHAIVDDTPGVTRDRREAEGRLADLRFKIIDTAGLEDVDDDSLEARMQIQTEAALEQADVALFLLDARAGVTPLDSHFSQFLRRLGTPVILVANKCEGKAVEAGIGEAYGLGLGDPLPISAEHGQGLSELYDALAPYEYNEEDPLSDDEEDSERALKLAIVGRPNVGKSTLVNSLLGEERMLTGPEAGITRDSIAIAWDYEGRCIQLADTAGMRRKARVRKKLESLSVDDTLRSIRYAEVVVLLLDAEEPMEKQDLSIARFVIEEGRALIVALNKWDLVKAQGKKVLQQLHNRLERSLPQVRGVPIVTMSALTGKGADKLLPEVLALHDIWNTRVSTSKLNTWLNLITEEHPPPLASGRRVRLRYITQAKTRPPTFALFVNRPEKLPDSYLRYLANRIRQDFNLPGVPLRLQTRKGSNPYAK